MKAHEPKFTTGSLFVCSKCGKSFDEPENAEKLKTDLRMELKKIDAHTQVRVMVGSCLGVCIDGEQAFVYYPNHGAIELNTTTKNYQESKNEILQFIHQKIKK